MQNVFKECDSRKQISKLIEILLRGETITSDTAKLENEVLRIILSNRIARTVEYLNSFWRSRIIHGQNGGKLPKSDD